MTTRASQLVRDQNVINLHCDGPSIGTNTNNSSISKDQKKGGGGMVGARRRALNDISNAATPSALQASSKKTATTNPSIVGKDVEDSKKKKQVGGRKPLGDLTNSTALLLSKPQVHKKGYDEKMISVAEEGFLHNHDKCIQEQKKAMDMSCCFLKEANDSSKLVLLTPRAYPPPLRSKDEGVKNQGEGVKNLELEELPELQLTPLHNSTPVCGESPMSPKALPLCMGWGEDVPEFSLIETPMLPKKC
ncbi:unnamed protein product [Cuscuta europaea]|uniref:Uncharacterized protein n=1 Tax=Cuscuta europaea TaxID=41803 RepID=A0A9P1EJQ0_CUSEU|nr:unnamed protein product [Cuscuta europaea]